MNASDKQKSGANPSAPLGIGLGVSPLLFTRALRRGDSAKT